MTDKIATYTFLPWLRQGIATGIKTQDPLGEPSGIVERASIDASVEINTSIRIDKRIDLVGPGDVVGINHRAIVKTEPRRSVMDFEPNYLPYIEFYDEDFAWRYTPAAATPEQRLRPWIYLATLAEEEYERGSSARGALRFITLNNPATALPNPAQVWAWAHVHAGRDITDEGEHSVPESIEELEALVQQNPDRASCRLMSPRKLLQNTRYTAFLIPAFETGRLAGLSRSTDGVDALAPAWGNGQTEFPVYFEWSFGTGSRGDFEYLVSLLEARSIDSRVGVRDMDVQMPEFGLDGLADPRVLGLEGALKSPTSEPRPPVWPPASATEFSTDLKKLVNLQADALEQDQAAAAANPIVGPPLYGRWHANAERLLSANDGWVHELNEDPRLRVAGGIATGVVQKNQEDYMQRAWRQLGEILKANKKIFRSQLALVANYSAYSNKIMSLSDGSLVAAVRPLLHRIKGANKTLGKVIADSRLPEAAVESAFKKITRPRGAIFRKAKKATTISTTRFINALNVGDVTAAPIKTTPKGQLSFNQAAPTLGAAPVPRIFRGISRRRLGRRSSIVTSTAVSMADALVDTQLTATHVIAVPSRDNFAITKPGSVVAAGTSAGIADSATAIKFRGALNDLHKRFETGIIKPVDTAPISLGGIREQLAAAINPTVTIPKRVNSLVHVSSSHKPVNESETISPIMAHPEFPDPMYAALRDIDSEFLVPNLGLIPQNTIGLLETNRRFIEAYMVGLNHEFGRELLWREFLTDQQGSYFRQFWDISEALAKDDAISAEDAEEALRDIPPIHAWPATNSLGVNENRVLPLSDDGDAARLVLLVRGDLLRKYPTAVIYAQKARWEADESGQQVRVLEDSSPEINVMEPLFKAEIHPDIKFLGFNLTAEAAKGIPHPRVNQPGWFFVLQERPGEPRFGLNVEDEDTMLKPKEWGDLAWSHLANQPPNFIELDRGPNTSAIVEQPDASNRWGSNAAEMAYLLYQTPVMVAFHAADMLRGSS